MTTPRDRLNSPHDSGSFFRANRRCAVCKQYKPQLGGSAKKVGSRTVWRCADCRALAAEKAGSGEDLAPAKTVKTA